MSAWTSPSSRLALLALLPFCAVAASYLPDLGRGFIRDDFAWILGSRHDGTLGGWLDLFRRHNGFYRPLVSVTFAIDDRLFGLEPVGYGLTNLLLAFGCMAGIFGLARVLGLSRGAAVAAAAIWGLNPHGIGGSVLWISGRTSLLLTLFALLAAIAAVRQRWLVVAVFYSLALFSKEQAVLLPILLLAFAWPAAGARRGREIAAALVAVSVPLAVYLVLRSRTGAFWPTTAPSYYRFVTDPAALLRNILEYTDRTFTFPAAVTLLAWAIVRRTPSLGEEDRRRLWLGVTWVCVSYGLTVFLPVRSSLYVCLPLVGAALIAAVLLEALARPGRAWRALAVAAVAVSLLMIPLHRSRNVRPRKMAELSASVFADLGLAAEPLARGQGVVLHDAVGERYNIEKAMGTLLGDALRLRLGVAAPAVRVEPPIEGLASAGLAPIEGRPLAHFWLRDSRLVALDPAPAR